MISRINFQTWVGNFDEINKIEKKHIKLGDKFIDINNDIYIFNGTNWNKKYKENRNIFKSSFFIEDFVLDKSSLQNLIISITDNTNFILFSESSNKNIELSSFECKILFNEMFNEMSNV